MSDDSVFADLREAIARGELEPGSSLVESDLMERFAAGRPAVRTAIVRLEQDGLVERIKNRSARVRLVPPQEALEIYRVRTLLEAYAVSQAAARATPADVDGLRTLIAAVDTSRAAGRMAEAVAGDTTFHRRILEIADNRTVARLCDTLHGHLVRYHHRTRVEQESSDASPREHRDIVDAIAAHDPSAATAAMTAHLERLTAILQRVLTT
jgi:DNA-binding GntR family transcriptional regulator